MNSKWMRVLTAAAAVSIAVTCAAQAAPPVGQEQQPKGQVIFSRSIDENGETQTHNGPAAALPPIQTANQTVSQAAAADSDRQAVTFTAFDMDVRLQAAFGQIAVRALLTVRNDGKTPLVQLPLQISSSLNWERIRLNGRDVAFQVATINTDTDHTGQLHEAVVPLPRPLPPGASLQLDVSYGGRILQTTQRLLAIGTPEDVARHADWDRIGTDFTGLRGFGNVVWYPVASVPAMLGDGARLFDEIGEHKLRLSGARFRLRLTDEFPHGQAPTIALINGHPAALTITESGSLDQTQEVSSVATAVLDGATLGNEAPSLFVAIRTPHPGTNATLWTLPENNVAAISWAAATAAVTPFLQGWLGQRPRAQLTLLDLPDRDDAPFETGSMLATVLREASSEQLNGIMAHALTHAYTHHLTASPHAWLDEGVAHFMGTLWVEKQRGRDQALGSLEAGRTALALIEPESPGQSAGQPLAAAISPVYFRTKAAYVLWMLRDVAGDEALSAALRAYDPAQETNTGGRSAFEKLIEQASLRHDLGWFFADWVDADKGLPDLSIEGVFPTAEQAGNWLVAVNVANNGYAAAEVSVTARTGTNTSTERLLVPARSKAVQRILIQGRPFEVQLNDGTIPETQTTIHLTKLDQAAGPGASSPSNPLR